MELKQNTYQPLFAERYYHIYNRGNNKERIFKEEINYEYFLYLWWKYSEPVAKTLCYSLLPNHFHFFIRVNECVESKAISHALSNFFNAYAKAINKKYNRTGSLFQERFRRKEIADNVYFTNLISYILTNAVKHGLHKHYSEHPYSAFHELMSNGPTSLLKEEVFEIYQGKDQLINFLNGYQTALTDISLFRET